MEKDLLYRLALTRVPGIGPIRAKALFNYFGEAAAIFRASPGALEKIRGIGQHRTAAIRAFRDFHVVEKELAFLERFSIRPLFFTEKDYPRRLLAVPHSPALLFYKGNADLNASKIISMVGTRHPTEYGKRVVEQFIAELAVPGLLIVSGLAYGIDAASHKAALKHQLPTVGVLAHGLDRVYPQHHAGLAKEMIRQGGLLTEFGSCTEPEEYNFPIRNRTVAGMSDALIVVETACRGGSMLTAENARAYGKKIFAFPGRITDGKSEGCNTLIQKGNALLLSDPRQFIRDMQWDSPQPAPQLAARQGMIFPSSEKEIALPKEEKAVLHLIRQAGQLAMDEILRRTALPIGKLSLILLNLELGAWIHSLPGRAYAANRSAAPS